MSPAANAPIASPATGPSPAEKPNDAKAAEPGTTGLTVTSSSCPGSRLALEVTVPGSRCQISYDQALARLSRSVKLPGFRKGKVPQAVLQQRIGQEQIRATALEELVDNVFREASRQEEIVPISRPELRDGFEELLAQFTPGFDLTFTLEMDVNPTPTLKATKGLKAEAEPVVHDPARVDELIEQSRRQLAALVPVDERPAAIDDVSQISFEGSFADTNEPISGGSSDGMEVELEAGRMIPGFIEGIVGMKVGETKSVTCTFPESYPQKEAAGRPARFDITLLELKTRELPALDDALAQQASEFQTLEELRADLESRLMEDATTKHRTNRRDALLAVLVEQLEVELPETLIQEEVRRLIEQTAAQVAQQGVDVKKIFTQDLIRNLMESSRPEAERQLRQRLALEALAEAEQYEVEASLIEAKYQEVWAGIKDPSTVDPDRLRQAVIEDLKKEGLLDWLEQNNEVTDKAVEPENSDATEPIAQPDSPAVVSAPTAALDASKAEQPID